MPLSSAQLELQDKSQPSTLGKSQKSQPKGPLALRFLRGLGYFIKGLAILLLAGALFEQLGAWTDNRRFPPTGTRVKLADGRRLYLDCRGSGSPTVLLEAGHRNWSPAWTLVQPQVAQFTRVCSYDRAGLGLSDSGPRPRTAHAAATDLTQLLHQAAIPPPYVLVGHSAGGMYSRVFTDLHRDQVAGLVLVDTDVPTDSEDRAKIGSAPDDRRTAVVLTLLTYSGVFRFLVQTLHVSVGPPAADRYPEEGKVRLRAGMSALARSINDEWDLYKDAYLSVRSQPLGALPVVVIAALGYRPDESDRADWLRRQKSLSLLSSQGKLITLLDEAHYVPFLQPDVVTGAVRDVVQSVRAAGY